MKTLLLTTLMFSSQAWSFDFSLKNTGPCGADSCQEQCEYGLQARGSSANVDGKMTSEYRKSMDADGHTVITSHMRIMAPGSFLGEEILFFDENGALKTYYFQLRGQAYGMNKMKLWARVDLKPAPALGEVKVIRATRLSDIDEDKAKAAAAGGSAEWLRTYDRQKAFATKYWSNDQFTADWIDDFNHSSGLHRLDMDLKGFNLTKFISPIYFNYLALRFLPLNEQQNFTFFSVASIHDGANVFASNLRGVPYGRKFVRWKSKMKIASVDIDSEATMSSSKPEIESANLHGGYFIFTETFDVTGHTCSKQLL